MAHKKPTLTEIGEVLSETEARSRWESRLAPINRTAPDRL